MRPSRAPDPDDFPLVVPKPLGLIVGISGPDQIDAAAVIWVPDPTQRGGWAEWVVAKPEPEPRRFGFQAPHEREA